MILKMVYLFKDRLLLCGPDWPPELSFLSFILFFFLAVGHIVFVSGCLQEPWMGNYVTE